MKKINIDDAWLQIIRGDVITTMDNKWRLQARLVRTALGKEKSRMEQFKIDDSKVLFNIHQACGTKNKNSAIVTHFSKWIGILVLGSGIVYATKTLLHFTEFQETTIISESADATINVITNDKKGFWSEWFDSSGGFIGFWSKLQLQHYDQVIDTQNSNCSPSNLIFSDCLQLAKQNNANAQFNVALMYEQGIQIDQNYEKAFEWYKKSAALGNSQAQFNMDYLIEKKLIH
jgi:hypothetical protein